MYTLKVVTTVAIVILMWIIMWFWKSTERTKATDYGFGGMIFVYILSLVCIWG